MKRREVITGLVGSLAFPRGLAAQPAERTYRLGVLSPGLSSYDTLRSSPNLASSRVEILWWTCA